MRKITRVPKRIKKTKGVYDSLHTVIDLNRFIKEEKNRHETLVEETEKLKRKLQAMKRKYEHYHELYSGLSDLKSLTKSTRDEKVVTVLKNEIQRLEHLSARLREEHIQIAYSNPLTQLTEPQLQKTLHPLRFVKFYRRYWEEKKEFNDAVKQIQHAQVHVNLAKERNGVHIQNDGTRHYKAEGIKIDSTYIELGDRFIRTYYLSDIPAYLSPYVFFKLLTSPLPFTISIFIEPTVSGSLIKKARQRLSILEMQQNERTNKGKLRDAQIDKSLEEISRFIEELVHETEKGILYSLYLTLEATSKDELKKIDKELRNLTDAIEFTFTPYRFGQKKAFETMMPFNNDTLKQNRILQSTAASYLMPFVTKQIYDPEGIFLGINAYHDTLVFVNPFTVRNSNVNILGVSGAGKSVTAKTLATRMYMRGTQIIIIDPEGEYVDFAKALGGEVIQFSRKNGINPFSLQTDTKEEVLDHIAILKTFFKFFIPAEKYDGAVLDRVLISLYKSKKRNFDTFLKKLKGSQMLEYLEVLNTGSLQGVFNAKRTLQLDSELIVFDISPLGDTEKKSPAMYLLTSLIWQLVNKKSDRKRMLFIDEAHKLLIDKDVAVFYREMVKQARKRNLGVVSITQDVEDFLNGEYGKAILTNSETKILLKQSYATLSLMGNIFPMTDEERQQLGSLGVGEMVLFRENEHMRADIFVLPTEERYVFPKKASGG